MIRLNPVYRCIEGTAHGFLAWERQDVIVALIAAVAVGVLSWNLLFGGGAGALALAAITLGRRAWHGRRDYVLLILRRLERRRVYRRLDRDRGYVPYGGLQ